MAGKEVPRRPRGLVINCVWFLFCFREVSGMPSLERVLRCNFNDSGGCQFDELRELPLIMDRIFPNGRHVI